MKYFEPITATGDEDEILESINQNNWLRKYNTILHVWKIHKVQDQRIQIKNYHRLPSLLMFIHSLQFKQKSQTSFRVWPEDERPPNISIPRKCSENPKNNEYIYNPFYQKKLILRMNKDKRRVKICHTKVVKNKLTRFIHNRRLKCSWKWYNWIFSSQEYGEPVMTGCIEHMKSISRNRETMSRSFHHSTINIE